MFNLVNVKDTKTGDKTWKRNFLMNYKKQNDLE